MAHIDRNRPILPPVYNAKRVIEKPIPPVDVLEFDDAEVNESTESIIHTSTAQSESGQEESLLANVSEQANNSSQVNMIEVVECDEAEVSENTEAATHSSTAYNPEKSLPANTSGKANNSSRLDVKPTVDDEDLVAFEHLFNDNRQIACASTNDVDPLALDNGQDGNGSLNGENSSATELRESRFKSIQFESTRIDAVATVENFGENESIADDQNIDQSDTQILEKKH